jgi:hypothetical protein
MFLTTEQGHADRRLMKAFVAMRIPEEGCRVVLADGPEGEVWVDLNPVRYGDGELDFSIGPTACRASRLPRQKAPAVGRHSACP